MGRISKFFGVGASLELTWITLGKDSSWFPYGTYTTSVNNSGGNGLSVGVGLFQGRFSEGDVTKSEEINRGMLSGRSYGLGVTTGIKWKRLELGVDTSYAPNILPNGKQDGSWETAGLSLSFGLKKKNVITESAFKGIIMETSKAIHFSPQKLDKKIDDFLEN